MLLFSYTGILEKPNLPPSAPNVTYKLFMFGKASSGKTWTMNRLSGQEVSVFLISCYLMWKTKFITTVCNVRLQTSNGFRYGIDYAREYSRNIFSCVTMTVVITVVRVFITVFLRWLAWDISLVFSLSDNYSVCITA